MKKLGAVLLLCLCLLGICISFNKESKITVKFVDENGTKLVVHSKTYKGKRGMLLLPKKLEREVPGYTPLKKLIFFKDKDQTMTLKFKSKYYEKEIESLKKAKYVGATFQPMTVEVKHGWQQDPYNTARVYDGRKTGKDSLRILYSNDGINWKKLNVSYPRVNLRDPSIAKINGYWYIVYTKGLVRTKDFRKWEHLKWNHANEFVDKHEWAPEFVKDKFGKWHVVMAGMSKVTRNFQLYISSFNPQTGEIANDWRQITLGNAPNNAIDANIQYANGKYILFYKNEDLATNKIAMATSDNLFGPYDSKQQNIDLGQNHIGAEGPEALIGRKDITLYFDTYQFRGDPSDNNNVYYDGLHFTKLINGKWTDLSKVNSPILIRHFSIWRN
ncbi:hypothetical protein AYP76_09550 [Ligilactobacillus agilis]|uniref:Beta-xylosidase n=1 Tax=Ligilactobacillus agilis TaxID=1601 RepID=A0A231Q762_9LACO|nr:family 43 glycosylhydrolase [Ligilactobacillus agilis]OXC06526.1 hypothetical protein AYP76_09550 [Ligilactobacillus agilis]OXC10272.1 hypothetical protein AYP75_05990 [Ligilactobacillus agilis]OXC11751.1 hypothetical protein AYP74_10395 [Ligilactobacillus agilis]OXS37445.1 hypothetical protein AYP69_10360 [Ligilactobacillus agilis]OXS42574.1 hypothetical protein AYP70_09950 [Ligilactobacillus agilis]